MIFTFFFFFTPFCFRLELGIGPNVQVSSPNAKHVRIQESDPKSADKVHLLESTSDTSVVSG